MTSRDQVSYTTNEHDQQEAKRLQERLKAASSIGGRGPLTGKRVPNVKIDNGIHKYVLIRASWDGTEEYFVTSKHGAHYHRNAAEPMVTALEENGYHDIEVTGGGRIDCDLEKKNIKVYGFSYGFGLADHNISRECILRDPRYKDFRVTISNDGY